jgi:hypothetical protein
MDVVLTKSSSDSVEKTGHIQRRKRKKTWAEISKKESTTR